MNSNFFAIADVLPGKLNALVKNIMRQTGTDDPNEAVRMVNAGEVQISVIRPEWTEKDRIIHFSVTSNGNTGEEWITRLESKNFRVGDYAKSILRSESFKPTLGVTTEIAVLRGEIFSDSQRITKNIRQKAKNHKFTTPNAEVACLIRDKFFNKELEAMGLYWIIVMHAPIKDFDGDSSLLSVDRSDDGSWLSSDHNNPSSLWDRGGGFAFVVSTSNS